MCKLLYKISDCYVVFIIVQVYKSVRVHLLNSTVKMHPISDNRAWAEQVICNFPCNNGQLKI